MSSLFNPQPRAGGGQAAFLTGQAGTAVDSYGVHAPRYSSSVDSPLSKSWLFEIVAKKSGAVKESFTLLMPPQSLTIKEPQRVSITKTFGNAFVDDYGPDNIQITLKGISGTTHVFPTYSNRTTSAFTDIATAVSGADQAGQNQSGYTGRNAFYTFRDSIMRYKDKAGWEKNELRVYDLADEQAYRCVLLDFTLDRSADSPFRYPYTISLFVFDKLDSPRVKKGRVVNISREPDQAMNDVDRIGNKLNKLYRDVQSVINDVALITAKVAELRTKYAQFLNQTTKIITSPLGLAKNLTDIALSALRAAYDTYRAGQYTFDRYIAASEILRDAHRQALKIYGFQISKGWQSSNVIEIEQDAGLNLAGESPSREVNQLQYRYNGLQEYTIKGADTLQEIAAQELNDEAMWPVIAATNTHIRSNADLVPGQTLYLPIQTDAGTGVRKENFILTEDTARDPYGTDIALDANGRLIIDNNDFVLVSGLSNVEQAVDLRLNTPAGTLLKHAAFGITAQAGIAGSELALKYLKTSIRSALTEDPRIEKVDNMIVKIDRDVLHIGMTINVIGAEQSLPVEVQV